MAKKITRRKITPRKKVPHPPATRLLLIRHGEVEARYQGIFGGRIDMNLSPRGKQQAKILADYLRVKTIDAVYASPMKRVQQTLAPTLKLHGHSQTIFHDLREIDFGDWTGMNWAQVQDKYDLPCTNGCCASKIPARRTARAANPSAPGWSRVCARSSANIRRKHRGLLPRRRHPRSAGHPAGHSAAEDKFVRGGICQHHASRPASAHGGNRIAEFHPVA